MTSRSAHKKGFLFFPTLNTIVKDYAVMGLVSKDGV